MLEMRQRCERCGNDLPASSAQALICSFECTFCWSCASEHLAYRCPNCAGPLVRRPSRHEPAEGSAVDAASVVATTRTHLWEVVIDCANPTRLARFYGELLDVEVVQDSEDWAYVVPSVRGPHAHTKDRPTGDGLRIAFQRVPEPRTGKVRLHLDFGADDLEALAERAVTLGGIQLSDRVHEGNGYWIVMADPEGHEFCLVDP